MKRLLLSLLFITGCTTTTYQVHVRDGADQQVRDILIKRRTQIVDLEAAGKQLVKDRGPKLAWQAVLDVWDELTGRAPLKHASNVIWLQNRPADVQDVAWMIQFKDQWL